MLNGERFSADVVYEKIYGVAKKSIYIIDNYIGVRTLVHLKNIEKWLSHYAEITIIVVEFL